MTASAKDVIQDDKLLELLHLAMDQGWEVKPTNNGKLMWFPKDKEISPVPSPTRLIGRSLKNVRTALERAGLDTSSLKDNKPKSRKEMPLIAVSDDPQKVAAAKDGDMELSEAELRHQAIQRALSGAATEIITGMDDFDGKTEHINNEIDYYLVQTARALIGFVEATRSEFRCGHDDTAELKTKLEEAERLYLETCQELEELRKHSERTDRDLSRVGSELQTALLEKNDALERALKAENRLRALRTALTED